MTLKAQDVLIALKVAVEGPEWTFRTLSTDLGLALSEVHKGLRRAVESDLLDLDRRTVRRSNLEEFICHGLRYVFPARRGSIVTGLATSFATAPLNERFSMRSEGLIPVWKSSFGTQQGYELEPLYPSVPEAALGDSRLYEMLALCDAIRDGHARERKLAQELIRERLGNV